MPTFQPALTSDLRTALESVCSDPPTWNGDSPELWDTSAITSFEELFKDLTSCNPNIANWDTSSVTTMKRMFMAANAFNRDISGWNTAAVTDMSQMFYEAHEFNQPIGEWDTSSVTAMGYMFYDARKFNQDLPFWDVSSVTTIAGIWCRATVFNGEVSTWKIHNVQHASDILGGQHGNPLQTAFDKRKLIPWDTSSMISQFIITSAPNYEDRGVQDINCPGGELTSWSHSYLATGNVNQRCGSNGIYTPMNITCDDSACNYPNGLCSFYDWANNKAIPLDPAAYSIAPNEEWSTGSWSYGREYDYPVRCICRTDYTGDHCENAPYNWNNINDEAACQSVHTSSTGCGGLFLCDSAPTPCDNLAGPLVNGAELVLDFSTSIQQTFTVQAGVANAFYRPYGSTMEMAYVAKMNVPSEALQNIAIMSTDSNTCADVKLVYGTPNGKNATVIDFTSRGLEGGFYGCDASLDGFLSITQLLDTSKMWLMVKKRTDGSGNQLGLGVSYTVTYANNNPVIPKDDRVFYRFSLNDLAVEDSTNGAKITLKVDPISHAGDADFDIADCQSDITQLLATISTQKGVGACSLALSTSSTNGTETTLVYEMTRAEYADCANDVVVEAEQPVLYQGRLVLPTIQPSVVSPGKECHFFQPQDDGRNYQISLTRDLASTSDLTTTSQIANFHSNISNVQAQACPGDRILKAKLVFDLHVEYSGTKESDTLTTGTLSPLPGSESGVTWNASDPFNGCTTNGNGGGTCRYRLVSDKCEFLYRTKIDKCIFGDTKFLTYHASLKETAGGPGGAHSVTHSLVVPTNQFRSEFDSSFCLALSETASTIDVTDNYELTLAVRNHEAAGIDWDSVNLASKRLVWEKPIAARLSVADLFNRTEVQIKSVKFDLKNYITTELIESRNLTRADKKFYMGSSTSTYYEDPHFCRDYDKDLSAANKCYPFYAQGTDRWNGFMTSFVAADAANHYHCTKSLGSADEHDSDYVTVDLSKWNTKPAVAHLSVTVTVVAIIEACEPGTFRRRDLDSNAVKETVTASAEFEIKNDYIITGIRFAGNNATPTKPLAAAVAVVATALAAMMM